MTQSAKLVSAVRWRGGLALAAFVALALAPAVRATPPVPGKSWERKHPSHWSAAGLKRARDYSATLRTAAVMIVDDGVVVDEWGQTDRKFNCHSIRKSLLSALYGIQAAEGRIRLSDNLATLGIDDNEPALSDVEKRATIANLLRSRSGVYHPALYETPRMKAMRPPRHSHRPGSFWYYNNWDFNALGTIYEKLTGETIFESFHRRIAQPLEMEDFTPGDGAYFTGPDSVHPAYPFRMTARDLARFGLLFLRKGQWGDRQVVPAAWVRESTSSYSRTGEPDYGGEGYGYMWWVGRDSFSARGAGGHYVVVVPGRRLVVVHRVDTDRPGNSVSGEDFERLLRLIFAAQKKRR